MPEFDSLVQQSASLVLLVALYTRVLVLVLSDSDDAENCMSFVIYLLNLKHLKKSQVILWPECWSVLFVLLGKTEIMHVSDSLHWVAHASTCLSHLQV